jgi:hypothetical protein
VARFARGSKGLVPHTTAPQIVHYQPGIKVMDDSVLSWGFDMPTTLPVIVFRGAGRVAGMLGVLANAPQNWSPLAIPTNSYGGSQAGKFILSPLVDTSGDTSGE